MKIFDAIFGKKKILIHSVLGKIESERIFGENQANTYNWSGVKKSNSSKEIFFSLDGNYSNPYSKDLSFIVLFIEHLERKFINEIIEKLYTKNILKNKLNFKNEYYLSAILSLGNHKFEVIFEKVDENEFNPLGIEYQNGIISKVYKV